MELELCVIEYIKQPPSVNDLALIAKELNMSPQDFLRKNDKKYKELNLSEFKGSNEELFKLMSENPTIIERPIVTSNAKAIIGRPPENIFKLFQQ